MAALLMKLEGSKNLPATKPFLTKPFKLKTSSSLVRRLARVSGGVGGLTFWQFGLSVAACILFLALIYGWLRIRKVRQLSRENASKRRNGLSERELFEAKQAEERTAEFRQTVDAVLRSSNSGATLGGTGLGSLEMRRQSSSTSNFSNTSNASVHPSKKGNLKTSNAMLNPRSKKGKALFQQKVNLVMSMQQIKEDKKDKERQEMKEAKKMGETGGTLSPEAQEARRQQSEMMSSARKDGTIKKKKKKTVSGSSESFKGGGSLTDSGEDLPGSIAAYDPHDWKRKQYIKTRIKQLSSDKVEPSASRSLTNVEGGVEEVT